MLIIYWSAICYRKESKIITQVSLIRSFIQVIFYVLLGVLSFITFSTHVGLGNVLTPFTVSSIYTVLRLYFIGFCAPAVSEMWVSFKCIEVSLMSQANIAPMWMRAVLEYAKHCMGLTPTMKWYKDEQLGGSNKTIQQQVVQLIWCIISSMWP